MAGESGPDRLEILESHRPERRGLWWRWQRQSARRRGVEVAAAGCVLVSAGMGWYLTRPQPPPPTPTEWPALHTAVAYRGTLPGPDQRPDFVISVVDQDAAPMTVTQISFSARGLTLRTDPSLPVQVQPGQSRDIQLIATASDCSGIPRNDELPFIDVTFRNTRAIGQISEILGDRYTLDLHRAMTVACRRS